MARSSPALGLWPVFLSYVLSFIYIGIYWNNHHHMLQADAPSTAAVLWANLHLLFWFSLIPFTTGWMGENHFARLPTLFYGGNLLACAIAVLYIAGNSEEDRRSKSLLERAIGNDWKGKFHLSSISSACWATGSIAPFVGLMFYAGLLSSGPSRIAASRERSNPSDPTNDDEA